MPTSSLHQAAGRFARIATPLTRYLPLITASLILTACGDGSLFPASLRRLEQTPGHLARQFAG